MNAAENDILSFDFFAMPPFKHFAAAMRANRKSRLYGKINKIVEMH